MKRSLYAVAISLILLASGFVVVRFVQSGSILLAEQGNTMQVVLPIALADLPDIEHIPVYPNASITKARSRSINDTYVVYEVKDDTTKVAEFYEKTLPKKGWLLRSNRGSILYSWANPAEKSFWNLYLIVTVESTLDDSKTLVDLYYGRYPNLEEGLPLYPNSQQIATTRLDVEKSLLFDYPAHITDVTYSSKATLQEIADFYNNSMVEYGWSFFDLSGSGPSDKQTGDVSSEQGLYFRSVRTGWNKGTSIANHLFVTATAQQNDQVVVKLHLEELEISNIGP